MNTAKIEDARQAKDLAKLRLAGVPGVQVVGVGLIKSDGGYAVKVNLDHSAPAGAIPDRLNGVPVVVEVVGAITSI